MTRKMSYSEAVRPGIPAIGDVLRDLQQNSALRRAKMVENWRAYLPEGSKWQPGLPGNPSCPTCKGFGYVRLELPVGHPQQGKVAKCECNKT